MDDELDLSAAGSKTEGSSDASFAERIEQARNSLIDALMHLNEINDALADDDANDDVFLNEDLSSNIQTLTELSEELEELQARFE